MLVTIRPMRESVSSKSQSLGSPISCPMSLSFAGSNNTITSSERRALPYSKLNRMTVSLMISNLPDGVAILTDTGTKCGHVLFPLPVVSIGGVGD